MRKLQTWPLARSQFHLTVATRDTAKLRPELEQALQQKGVTYELRGSAPVRRALHVRSPHSIVV